MRRIGSVGLIVALTATTSSQSALYRGAPRENCIAALSSFAVEPSVTKPPDLPADLNGVKIEYDSSGCYGNCPAFALRVEKGVASWEGHAFVRKKGKARKQISDKQFSDLVQAWLDAKIYAMRDDYCDVTCPDGTSIVVTDVLDTTIKFQAPFYSKKVLQCFTSIDGKPRTPKPPDAYFDLSRQLREVAKSYHWL